jgi:eukaryotic-like serine/threonine-protein kinase
MSACPDRELLLAMLDERLGGPVLDELENHIETCGPCQFRLEQMTRGQGGKTTQVEVRARLGPGEHSTAGSMARLETDKDDLGWRPYEVREEAVQERKGEDFATTDPDVADTNRTVAQCGSENGPVRPGMARRPLAWPNVPGYEILDRLGEGGMGVVYKARQLGLNRLVALKMIRDGIHARPDLLTRFRIEAEAVARLGHPNVIQIYDIGEVDNLPFVVLELLEGGSLADRLASTPQSGRPSAELLVTLARAVHAAHDAGIVHRDLKPTNILFTADGVPKVTDFGLAKLLESDSKQTESGLIVGSPSYMAPEQARGQSREIRPAADTYALGAILYEMLTGRPPFKGETPIETMRQVIDDDPVRPSRLVPRVARDLETISLKCLKKAPHNRYESAQSLADDLERFLRGEPIKARPSPFWERGAKWARRRPIAAAAAALVSLVVLGSFAGTLAYQHTQADNRQRESDRIMAAQTKGYDVLRAADKSIKQSQLTDAKATLTRLQGELAKESARNLRELSNQAGLLLEGIERQLAEQNAAKADRARYVEFRRARNEALFHDTGFTGLNQPADQAATRRAALAALSVFADPSAAPSWSLRALPASLAASEQNEIREGCYELLLVLSRAADRPEESLRFLERAGRLRPPTMAYHLRRADYLSKTGDVAAAQREQQAADAAPPTTALDYFLLGQEQYKRGDLLGANRHCEKALQLDPGHFWARCLSSICYLRLQRPTVAKVSLTFCIEREPEDPWLYIWRGSASYQLAAIAGEQLKNQPLSGKETLRDDASDNFVAALADYEQAMRLLGQKPDNELRWVLLVNRGLLFVQHEDWDKALADFREATRVDDRRQEAFVGLARVYQRKHEPDEAAEQFSRAIARNPGSAPLYRGRAEVGLACENLTPVERARVLLDLDRAIRLEAPAKPVLALDQTRRAALLHQDHRDAEALAACDAALKVVPDYKAAHHLRIQVLLDLKRYDDMIRSCESLLARDKGWAALYELRGLARAGLRDLAGAIEDDTQAIALEPGRALLFVRRGNLHLASDAPKLALHDFDVALGLNPTDGDALSGRGAARVRVGLHREAVADTEKALTLGKPTARRLYSAARIYARAAAVATAEVRKRGQDTVRIVASYQDRGTMLLGDAIKKLPSAERAAFWRDVVQTDPDPAMGTLRRRLRSADLAGAASSAAARLRPGE